jgi:peptide-methionine (S)-S-oxide reductase
MMYQDEAQLALFAAARERAQQHWDDPIVTEITPLDTYYPAEEEHQDYFAKQPASGYCSVVIAPKIIKARAAYAQWFA